MPELPEVQTTVNDLNRKIKGLSITGIWTDWPKYLKKGFAKEITGKKIIKIWRIGKNIIFDLSGGKIMLIHQKMTGHLLAGKWLIEKVNSYIHVVFFLSNGEKLALSDLRKFAKILAVDKKDFKNLEDIKNIGPDPSLPGFKFDEFKKLINKKRGAIKKVLMAQNVISGIGNIYADEILFTAKIHPLARTEKLNAKKLKQIFNAIKKILKKAVKLRGTSTYDYRDTAGKPGHYGEARLVYQRKGEKCPRLRQGFSGQANKCDGIIKRIKVDGRSAHFCPICQKL
ncbi:MAG: DNA-formamidopyrimidine glycosylase [Candidatus Azambacteria bacterium]|nr:DNA-formamidopyrimidine glycosylase [Candidatus Azambacteria bacterium]